jgi:hypothetical protein
MKGIVKFSVVSLCLFASGCALVCDGVHAVGTDVADSVNDILEQVRNRKWARGAWDVILSTDPHQYSKDYARGFKDGFAAFLGDGQGEPPAVAPARYRSIFFQTPQGYHAIEDWFAGYNRGVAVAINTGCRRWVTGPLAAPVPSAPMQPTPASELESFPSRPGLFPRARFGKPQALDSDVATPGTR